MENEIIYKYLRNETTAAEDLRVAEWLESDPEEHQKQLDSVRLLFEAMELHGTEALPASRQIRLSWRTAGHYVTRIAAVVLLALGVGHLANRQVYNTLSDQTNIVQVPAGQRMELTLADGTHVALNSEATIEYPVVFARKSRAVKLSGEALFEVMHDKKRPFIVETFASEIKVLGTKFNVNAEEKHNRFSTALLEGSVLVSNKIDPRQKAIEMRPNDVVSLKNGQLHTDLLKDEESLCWTEGLLYVTGLSFPELMDKFEQAFAVRIVIDRQTLPDIGSVGGKIRVNAGIDNALRILKYAADFRYEIDETTNTVTIR